MEYEKSRTKILVLILRGYFLADQRTRRAPNAPKKKAPPKYRNPEDDSSTWTGRGRKPLWVLAALESGKSLDDLLI